MDYLFQNRQAVSIMWKSPLRGLFKLKRLILNRGSLRMLYISSEGLAVKTIKAGETEKALQELLEETAASHEPIQIISEPSNGILISEEDCRATHETLYLLSIPGMRESIRAGIATPLEECSAELNCEAALP